MEEMCHMSGVLHSQAETAALQKFKKELSRVCGHDVLKINCYSRSYG